MELTKETPVVSIGMPVFNGEETICNAVESLLAQSFKDFELIISDNASTDHTERICREYERKDNRVKYFRQKNNIGPTSNFNYVLEKAQGTYFMWAAADDCWANEFIHLNQLALDKDKTIVASIGKVENQGEGDSSIFKTGCFPIKGSLAERVTAFILTPEENSRFYSLFRKEVLLKSFEKRSFVASDWLVSLRTLKFGGHHLINQTLMTRSTLGHSSDFLKLTHQNRPIFRLFPLFPFTFLVLKEFDLTWGFVRELLKKNCAWSLNSWVKHVKKALSINGS